MTHDICRECETCSICMKLGCRGYLDKLEAMVLEREIANRAPLTYPVIDESLLPKAETC